MYISVLQYTMSIYAMLPLRVQCMTTSHLFIGCIQTWTQATTYLQLIGVLLGQLTFGFLGDAIGRRATMLIDMSTILIGVIMLTVSNGATINVNLVYFLMVLLESCPVHTHTTTHCISCTG